jgi:hypothetical protein
MRKLILFIIILLTVTVSGVYAQYSMEFNHDDHLEILDNDCQSCHIEDARDIVPERDTCMECHEESFIKDVDYGDVVTHRDSNFVLEHKNFVGIEKYECASCHEQAACVDCHVGGIPEEMGGSVSKEVRMHMSDFIVGHPLMAKKDPQSCMNCHEQKYCSDCHTQFADDQLAGESHRKSWSNLLTSESGIPHSSFSDLSCQTCHADSVLPAHEWSDRHARDARKNLASCQTCHSSGDTCIKCHSARSGLRANPHPENWDDIKDKLSDASDGRTCKKCH